MLWLVYVSFLKRWEGEQGQQIYDRNLSMAPRNIQMAAMDSPVFNYVVFYVLLMTCIVGSEQRGCPGRGKPGKSNESV